MLKIQDLSVHYGEFTALDNLSFTLEEGQWLMLIGPNGAGKSTVVEAIAQNIPYTGLIAWDHQDIRSFHARELARKMAFLSQKNTVNYAFTVEEIVELGRYAYRGGKARSDACDRDHIEAALEQTGLQALRHANVLTLSGGELQRVFLAQLFAQDPQILILDEPTNHLDLKFQEQLFQLILSWLSHPHRAVLTVVHDLNIARHYGTHAILLHHGHAASQGRIEEVMTNEHLSNVYGMDIYAWMRSMYAQWSGV